MLRTTLRQIEVFVATVQKGSVTQAAAAIGLTQSAASMALADFERQLGSELFARHGKRLLLNEAGRMLYPKAVAMLERAQEMEALFGGTEIVPADLRLAASVTVGNYLLPPLIGRFSSRYPGSRIRLDIWNTERVIEAVRNFEIDLGFVEGPCLAPDVVATYWQDDELAICAGRRHPLARERPVKLASLRAADWVLREQGSGTREVVEQLLTEQIGPIRLALELGGVEAIKRAVAAGAGISCLPRVALTDATARSELVVLPTPKLRLRRPLHFVLHKQKYLTAGLERFIALCTATTPASAATRAARER